MSVPPPSAPGPDRRTSDARHADQPAGRPPWAPRARLNPATVGCAALIAVGAAGVVVSLLVAAWRLLDHATDLR